MSGMNTPPFQKKNTKKNILHMGVEPKIGGKPPKWMVKIMENPMNKWMISGAKNHPFWVQQPYFNPRISREDLLKVSDTPKLGKSTKPGTSARDALLHKHPRESAGITTNLLPSSKA